MIDNLGDRMKGQYEDRTRMKLPRRTYTVIRIDGKAFHTYTKTLQKPFDSQLIHCLNEAALAFCRSVQGVKLGYVQSDEMSFLLTDFDDIRTDAWFDGNIQKMASVSASIVTAAFANEVAALRAKQTVEDLTFGHNAPRSKLAAITYFPTFDARVFTIPDRTEVENYFIWRQKDAIRNAIQSVAQAHFSAKQLEGVSCQSTVNMLHRNGVYITELSNDIRYGRLLRRRGFGYHDDDTDEWYVRSCTDFVCNRSQMAELIPSYPETQAVL